MQAIHTKFIGQTNTRATRIKATCAAGSVTIPYPDMTGQAAHRVAAEALRAKMGWKDHGALLGGCLPDGSYCFVFVHALSEE